jgi:hypothetical protein
MTELVPPKVDPKDCVETICLNCVFAEWADHVSEQEGHEGDDVRIQTGCQLDMLKRFSDVGTGLGEYVDDKSGDEFCSIEGRVCMYNRPKRWKDKWARDDLVLQARKEVIPKVTLVIYMDKSTDLYDLESTMMSLQHSTQQPVYVIIVLDDVIQRPSDIRDLMDEHCQHIDWRVEFTTFLNKESRVIDMCSKKTKSTFLLFVRAGDGILHNIIARLDAAINDKLEQILIQYVNDDPFNHLLIHNSFIRRMAGHFKGGNIIEEAKDMLEEQECQHLMKRI